MKKETRFHNLTIPVTSKLLEEMQSLIGKPESAYREFIEKLKQRGREAS
jgi:hypothetical protein